MLQSALGLRQVFHLPQWKILAFIGWEQSANDDPTSPHTVVNTQHDGGPTPISTPPATPPPLYQAPRLSSPSHLCVFYHPFLIPTPLNRYAYLRIISILFRLHFFAETFDHIQLPPKAIKMSLSNKLSIEDVDLKGKRVLIRVRFAQETCDIAVGSTLDIHPTSTAG